MNVMSCLGISCLVLWYDIFAVFFCVPSFIWQMVYTLFSIYIYFNVQNKLWIHYKTIKSVTVYSSHVVHKEGPQSAIGDEQRKHFGKRCSRSFVGLPSFNLLFDRYYFNSLSGSITDLYCGHHKRLHKQPQCVSLLECQTVFLAKFCNFLGTVAIFCCSFLEETSA